ncbi:hypothetical protein ACFLQL_00045 [Verrucomicrobiota bacterium]
MKTFLSILILMTAVSTAVFASDARYAIYCNTETQWLETVSSTAVTNCPNSPAHSVRSDSVRIVDANPNNNILPLNTNSSIGTAEQPFYDGYFGANSIHLGDQHLTATGLETVKTEGYTRPIDVLFYYGWLNSFNSAIHSWNNEKVAQDLARYEILVFGDGIADTNHGDYANAAIIIPRVRALNPKSVLFGYVQGPQDYTNFTANVDEWEAIGANGIFIDEAGYDFGLTRTQLNERVSYVHSMTNANIAFANGWNIDNILGTNNDASYPNSTYNVDLTASELTAEQDWVLLESFPINTTEWTTNDGYEAKSDWYVRGSKFVELREEYDVNFCGVIVIANASEQGQDLFNFGFISSLMWCLDGFGSSDTSYGSGTAQVTLWDRPDISGMGTIWASSPTTMQDVNDNDVYIRYSRTAKLLLDFSSGAHTNSIQKW